MRVTICGPNLRDQSQGDFHVHAAGCADLVKHAKREPEYRHGWTTEADTLREIVEEVYSDMIDEDDEYSTWDMYESDLHFFPCVTLPRTI